ncbi:exported protein of unknown function [Modestobacter italicus]|uniref:Uncharacterized protein n=1 Tax=Modestobacter italicus (strain DSM 44449 / CECT 9708 / BC 501) TaxID=2732864 RepID=I4ETP7_MODI5|nr:hypothetical protein [Modestobacter marinus]CCH86760.1 exported protein of unknown function [Modestobacter marinus]
MNGTQKTGVGLTAGATGWLAFLVLDAGDLASRGVVLAVLVVGLLALTTAVVLTVQLGRRAA